MTKRMVQMTPATNELDAERHEFLRRALRGAYPNTWLIAVDSVTSVVVFEDASEGLWQASFTVGDNNAVTFGQPVEVKRITTFEPLGAPSGVPVTGNRSTSRRSARRDEPEEFDYHKEQAAIDRAEARAFNAETQAERKLAELEAGERRAWIRHHDEQSVAFPVVNILSGPMGSSILDRKD